jgi:lipoprotein-anchoring transpeptidase ErfK/SrfK
MRIPGWIRVVGILGFAELLSATAFPQEPSPCNPQVAHTSRPDPVPRETGYAHVEVDLSRQQLLVVDDAGCVVYTLPVSTGSGRLFTFEGITRRAVTPTGRFTVLRKITGWREAPLGMLYYPNYLTESGIAIHGSSSVPARPASHGCIRIPNAAAKAFSDMTPIGTVVLVY